MGIQFRLGPNDHKQVEDFLSREHAGTDAITLDVKAEVETVDLSRANTSGRREIVKKWIPSR